MKLGTLDPRGAVIIPSQPDLINRILPAIIFSLVVHLDAGPFHVIRPVSLRRHHSRYFDAHRLFGSFGSQIFLRQNHRAIVLSQGMLNDIVLNIWVEKLIGTCFILMGLAKDVLLLAREIVVCGE